MAFTRDQLQELDALVQKRNALQRLVTHDGWKHVVEEFNKASAFAYKQMVEEKSDRLAAVYTGTHYAAANVATYPEREAARLDMQIKLLERAQG